MLQKKQPPLLSAVIASPLICIPFNREGQRVSIADTHDIAMPVRAQHLGPRVLQAAEDAFRRVPVGVR